MVDHFESQRPVFRRRADAFVKEEEAAIPKQLDALVEFAGRAMRRPIGAREREELLSLYRALRDGGAGHDEAFRGMLARDSLRYRRQSLGLKRHFAGRDCTVLLLDDRTAEGNDLQLQSIAHGVIMMQSLERDFGSKRRRLEVRKVRGAVFREGYHDYTIQTGGVVVYPRLVAAEHRDATASKPVPSGLPNLDELLGGGIDSHTSTLLVGPAGCGKSSIAMRIALSAAERGEGESEGTGAYEEGD